MSQPTRDPGARPSITCAKDGPLLVSGLEKLTGADGPLEAGPRLALCRCGQSATKPFCDGSHGPAGFSGEKAEGRPEDRRDSYVGHGITVHDNRSICAHAGVCTSELPTVWRMDQEPWIDAQAATAEEILAVVERCPSGALSYTLTDEDGTRVERRNLRSFEPAIHVAPKGPYVLTGPVELVGIERAEGATHDRCTLCRCGASRNKPFCDGTHWTTEFDG